VGPLFWFFDDSGDDGDDGNDEEEEDGDGDGDDDDDDDDACFFGLSLFLAGESASLLFSSFLLFG
jgi:hypothetical protein